MTDTQRRRMTRLGALAILWTCLAPLATPAAAGDVLARVEKNKELVVATDQANPPASFLNDKSELDGFDVAVAKEVAKRLGVTARFITPTWDVITAGNWHGRWDISVGSMTPTSQRRRVLDFPAIYYYAPAALAVHTANTTIQSIGDASGKKIGTQAGSTYEQYLAGSLKIDAEPQIPFKFQIQDAQVTPYEGEPLALDDLRLGDGTRLDAVVVSQQSILGAIRAGYPIRQVGGPLFQEPLGIAIEKGDDDFAKRIHDAIEALRADGTLKRLSTEWFHADYTNPASSN